MGMLMCHTILLQREKGNVNASLLNGNANLPHNSSYPSTILLQREKGKANASLDKSGGLRSTISHFLDKEQRQPCLIP
jgi:preprotein translocase subunit SecG